MVTRENVTLEKTAWGTEFRCTAGQTPEPSGCERHSSHHYCKTCEGWYGVPHDRIHEGVNKHPRWDMDCACRPCRDAARARLARKLVR